MMSFKTSTILFLVICKCLEEASGEPLQCGDNDIDPDTQYCMTNGGSKIPMCRIGHCLKNFKCVPKNGNDCDLDCSEEALIDLSGSCHCIGAKSGPNCDGVPSEHSCESCTVQQVCTPSIKPCFGDIAICDLVKCQHGGTCSGTTFDDYTCTCAPGYSGKHCEYKKFSC